MLLASELRPQTFMRMIPLLVSRKNRCSIWFGVGELLEQLLVSDDELVVNGFVLMTNIPLCYCTRLYSITGHIFALKKSVYEQSGALDNFSGYIGGAHEIARNIRTFRIKAKPGLLRCMECVFFMAYLLSTNKTMGCSLELQNKMVLQF